MLIGLALIVAKFGSLDFAAVLGAPGETIAKGTATAISLLLFAGAIGKSAQVPLHVWLPDAMAGPTPVSALIHAATMVTAGVYLVVRSAPLFELSGVALTVVLIVGLVTMLFAATCALAQDDIKRVLAYSTISQLGFMFMAVGHALLHGGDVHARRPRVLQGADVPRCGLRDAWDARGDRPATDGRADPTDAGDGVDVRRRRVSPWPGSSRSPASSRRTRSSSSRTARAGRGSTSSGRSARSCPRCTSGGSCSSPSSGGRGARRPSTRTNRRQ